MTIAEMRLPPNVDDKRHIALQSKCAVFLLNRKNRFFLFNKRASLQRLHTNFTFVKFGARTMTWASKNYENRKF